jgi:hypothetical protein
MMIFVIAQSGVRAAGGIAIHAAGRTGLIKADIPALCAKTPRTLRRVLFVSQVQVEQSVRAVRVDAGA